MNLELHFQDGFSGETIEVLVDGEVRARFQAKTRYQIGLAHIEKVSVEPGQRLEVRLAESGTAVSVPVDSDKTYCVVSRKLEQLFVNTTDRMPGYL